MRFVVISKTLGVYKIIKAEEHLLNVLALPSSLWVSGRAKLYIPSWAVEIERYQAANLNKLYRESSRRHAPLPSTIKDKVKSVFDENKNVRKVVACAVDPSVVRFYENKKNGSVLVQFIADGLPKKVLQDIEKWDIVNKSPYSLSAYDSYGISWDSKPEGSLRVADHWNWYSDGEYHCKTEDGFKDGWAMGVRENGVYRIVKKY